MAKLHVAAFLFKIAARDPAFGQWMRIAFVIAIAKEFAKMLLADSGVCRAHGDRVQSLTVVDSAPDANTSRSFKQPVQARLANALQRIARDLTK